MAWWQAAVLALVAAAVAQGYFFYFDVTPKAVVLLAGTAVALILAVRRRPAWPRAPRRVGWLLLANGASLAVATYFSANRALALFGSTWRCYGAAMQCAVMLFAWLAARNRSRTVLAGVAMAAAILVGMRAVPWSRPNPLLWRDTLAMAAKRPLVGYGPEVFLAQFPRFESKALARAAPDAVYESPRNVFLDVLIAQGAVGLVLLGGFCAMALAAAWKLRSWWLAAMLLAEILAMQFAAFTIPTALLFWTTVTVAVGLGERPGVPRASPVLSFAAPFAVLLLAYGALCLAMADRSLVMTRRLLALGEYRATTGEYEKYSFWRLPGSSSDVWYSRIWLDVARNSPDSAVREQALEIAEDAAARSTQDAEEPFAAWVNRAQIATQREDFQGAESCLRKAIAAAPCWYRPHSMLAGHLRRGARLDEAASEDALAAELNPSIRNETSAPDRNGPVH